MAMQTVTTKFTAAQHGFKFVNSFSLADGVSLGSVTRQPVGLTDVVFGLCGGMCFAALDYFHADKPIPAFSTVDTIPSKLRTYLMARQLDSLGGGTVLKVLTWTLRSDNSLAVSVAGWEAPKLRDQLTAGPVVLALIRVGGFAALTNNHQVVATGYDFDDETKDMVVHLYDPNYPGEAPTLNMNLTKPSTGIALTQSSGDAVRGFFVLGYLRTTPPQIT